MYTRYCDDWLLPVRRMWKAGSMFEKQPATDSHSLVGALYTGKVVCTSMWFMRIVGPC
jgi:hypothetical protein